MNSPDQNSSLIKANSKSGSEYAQDLVLSSCEAKSKLQGLTKTKAENYISAQSSGHKSLKLVGIKKGYAEELLDDNLIQGNQASSSGDVAFGINPRKLSKKNSAKAKVYDLSKQKKIADKAAAKEAQQAISVNGSGNGADKNSNNLPNISTGNMIVGSTVGLLDECDECNGIKDQYVTAQKIKRSGQFAGQQLKKVQEAKRRQSFFKKARQKMAARKSSASSANVIKKKTKTALQNIVGGFKDGFASLAGCLGGAMASVALPFVAIVIGILLVCAIFIGGAKAIEKNEGYGNLKGVCLDLCVFLRERGVPDIQIAAICGNVFGESGYRLDAVESNGEGYGLCQWSFGRKAKLLEFAKNKGKDWTDENVQFEFLWAELKGEGEAIGYAGVQLNWSRFENCNNTDDATYDFMMQFERPSAAAAESSKGKRQEEAKRVYEQLTSGNSSYSGDNEAVKRAYECLGKPYLWGAAGPDSYDCSGLVAYCLTGQHRRIGTTYTFMGWTSVSEPKEGDVLVTDEHCGLYIGNGKMIHAPQPGETVTITSVDWFLAQGAKYVRYGG